MGIIIQQYEQYDRGVYFPKIFDIFARPLFEKWYFPPSYSENFLFFPHHPSLYLRFFLINHHIFPHISNTSYFKMKNTHPLIMNQIMTSDTYKDFRLAWLRNCGFIGRRTVLLLDSWISAIWWNYNPIK